MTGKKIAVLVLVLVLVGLVLALAIGVISAPDVSEGSVIIPAVKNASVSPAEGRYTDSFTYTVDVRFYEEALIALQLYDPTKKDWITYKTKEYRDTLSWETLRWDWIPSDRAWEGQNVSYRFRWNNTYFGYGKGPYIIPVIAWEFRNAIVRPSSGYYNDKFSYSVSVKLNKEEEISLEVFNISSYTWEVRGEKQYTNTGNWQEMKWDNIANIASADSEGLASYRFFFIESGERHESGIYYGPTLKHIIHEEEEIFKNATVDPHSGYYDTAFTYSVEANRSGDVYLLVYDISIDKWQKEINGTNTSDSRWEWKNISFSTACEGLASYKFVAGTHESGIFYGPTLKSTSGGGGGGGGGYYEPWISYKNATVDPNWVVIGVRERKTFNYSVEVERDSPLILEVYNLSSTVWEEKGKGEKSKLEREKGKWKHEWTVTLTLDGNWVGRGKYRFYPEGLGKYASQVYYGPDYKLPEGSTNIWKDDIPASNTHLAVPTITANVEPKEGMWFKKFTYTANVKHPNKAKMMVVLFVYKPESDDWVPVAKGRRYNYIINTPDYDRYNKEATVRWTVDRGTVFDEDDAGEWSRFYIWYWDGWNEIDCEKAEREGYDEGPKLLSNGEPHVAKLPELNYDVGSTSTVFEYSFDVEDDVNDTLYGLLTVIDPLNSSHSLSKVEKTDNNGVASFRFIVDPDSGIFTEDKLNKNGNDTFTSRYRLEYWDECREMMGIGERYLTDWFTGPNVTKVNVNYTEPVVSPKRGTYADEFEYRIEEFFSDRDNTISLNLTIYDPTDRNKTWYPKIGRTIDLEVPAGGKKPASWKCKPTIFGPEDCGKNASYTIAWKGVHGNRGIINGTGPYIERAVPLLSLDPPLVPLVSMVIVPLGVIGASLLSVLSGVPVSSLLKGGVGKLRKKREKGAEEKKGEKKEEAED
jgi:hypothetical protein